MTKTVTKYFQKAYVSYRAHHLTTRVFILFRHRFRPLLCHSGITSVRGVLVRGVMECSIVFTLFLRGYPEDNIQDRGVWGLYGLPQTAFTLRDKVDRALI